VSFDASPIEFIIFTVSTRLMFRPCSKGANPMPERFESNVFDPATTALMKSALEAALLKRKPSRADEEETRTLLASAVIDQVNAGEWNLERIVDKAVATLAVAQNISRSA
jgi:hypothetical protein